MCVGTVLLRDRRGPFQSVVTCVASDARASVKDLDDEGDLESMHVHVQRIAGAVARKASYDWQYSTDEKTWASAETTFRAKTTLVGLAAGTRYFFRFRARTPEGLGDWSRVLSWIVLRTGFDGGAPLTRRAHVEESPDFVEEEDNHPSTLAGDGQELAGDLRKLAVDVRERAGDR